MHLLHLHHSVCTLITFKLLKIDIFELQVQIWSVIEQTYQIKERVMNSVH